MTHSWVVVYSGGRSSDLPLLPSAIGTAVLKRRTHTGWEESHLEKQHMKKVAEGFTPTFLSQGD